MEELRDEFARAQVFQALSSVAAAPAVEFDSFAARTLLRESWRRFDICLLFLVRGHEHPRAPSYPFGTVEALPNTSTFGYTSA